jgi:hypothetical protein
VITFDTVIDATALLAAPPEHKLAAMNAYHVHFNPANPQAARDAGARFFFKILLPFVCGRPN